MKYIKETKEEHFCAECKTKIEFMDACQNHKCSRFGKNYTDYKRIKTTIETWE